MERYTSIRRRRWSVWVWLLPLGFLALGSNVVSLCISAVSGIFALPITHDLHVASNGFETFNTELLMVYIIATIGLNIASLPGLMSIGHGALFGLGAYIVAVLTVNHGWSFWPALICSAVASAALGLLLGLPALRLGLFALVMATLGFSIVFSDLALQWTGVTGGGAGIQGVPMPAPFSTPTSYYWLLAAFLVVVFAGSATLLRSPIGRRMKAVGEMPQAAQTLGIGIGRQKLIGFSISGLCAGVAGGLYAPLLTFVSPGSFTTDLSILILLMVLFGGRGTLVGPVVGAVILFRIPIEINQVTSNPGDISLLVYGAILLASVYFFPRGVMSGYWWAVGRLRKPPPPIARTRASLRIEGAGTGPASVGMPLLETRSIAKTLGAVKAVKDVSVSVSTGQVHALIGPNGAGKTTFLNIVSGFTEQDAGSIELKGETVPKSVIRRARRGLARTFQVPQVFEGMSCIENVMVALDSGNSAGWHAYLLRLPSARKEERSNHTAAMELLAAVGLTEKATHSADTLPPGERRLLEIARVLALKPVLVLMDEPAAGLNSAEIDELAEMIRSLRDGGIGVLLVEHHMDMVLRLSDVVTVIDYGTVIAHGSPAEIKTDPKVLEAYLGTGGATDAGVAVAGTAPGPDPAASGEAQSGGGR